MIDADVGHDLASPGSFTAQFVARPACLRDDVAMHIMRWSPEHDPAMVAAMSREPVGRKVTIITTHERVAEVHHHHYTTTEELRRLNVRVKPKGSEQAL